MLRDSYNVIVIKGNYRPSSSVELLRVEHSVELFVPKSQNTSNSEFFRLFGVILDGDSNGAKNF